METAEMLGGAALGLARRVRYGVSAAADEATLAREAALDVLLGLGSTTRRVWVERVVGWSGVSMEAARAAAAGLEALGEVTAASGGRVSAAPVRAVVLAGGEEVLVVGTLPTAALARRLGCEVGWGGLGRRVRRGEAARGGLPEVALERWTGMDGAPVADGALVEAWGEAARAGLAASGLGGLVVDGAQRYAAGRWARGGSWVELEGWGGEVALVREQAGGYGRYRVVVAGAGGAAHGVEVSRDEAWRLAWALEGAAGTPPPLRWRGVEGGGVEVALVRPLPWAEHRALVASAEARVGEGWPARYRLRGEAWEAVSGLLASRLGASLEAAG